MIDQQLIKKTVESLTHSFENRRCISAQLSSLQNAFVPELQNKLYEYILNQSDQPWQAETTTDYKDLNQPRRKISWHAETVIEELHEAFSALTPMLATMTCKDLKFHGIVLWEDSEGYEIDWHTDNPLLMVTIQIYIAGSSDNPGTEFRLLNGDTHRCDFKINTGYLIDQTKQRLSHHTTGKVPDLSRRYSLFAMWK